MCPLFGKPQHQHLQIFLSRNAWAPRKDFSSLLLKCGCHLFAKPGATQHMRFSPCPSVSRSSWFRRFQSSAGVLCLESHPLLQQTRGPLMLVYGTCVGTHDAQSPSMFDSLLYLLVGFCFETSEPMFSWRKKRLGVMAHTYNSSVREGEAGGSLRLTK